MEYGVIYLKIIEPEWVKYCHIFSALPLSFRNDVIKVTDGLNVKYKDNILTPFTYNVQNGCVVKSEYVEEVAINLLSAYKDILIKQSVNPCIRVVFSTGVVKSPICDSIHVVNSDDVVVKVGRFLDSSDEIGIFKI